MLGEEALVWSMVYITRPPPTPTFVQWTYSYSNRTKRFGLLYVETQEACLNKLLHIRSTFVVRLIDISRYVCIIHPLRNKKKRSLEPATTTSPSRQDCKGADIDNMRYHEHSTLSPPSPLPSVTEQQFLQETELPQGVIARVHRLQAFLSADACGIQTNKKTTTKRQGGREVTQKQDSAKTTNN